jgi:hypothetical protein
MACLPPPRPREQPDDLDLRLPRRDEGYVYSRQTAGGAHLAISILGGLEELAEVRQPSLGPCTMYIQTVHDDYNKPTRAATGCREVGR